MQTFVLHFYMFFKAIHPTVKTVGFLAVFFVKQKDDISKQSGKPNCFFERKIKIRHI